MQTYGFDSMTIMQLDATLKPIPGTKVVINGTPKEGAAASFDLTGLTKAPKKVFGSNVAYYVARKGHGEVAANFGILDIPALIEHEMLGHTKTSETSKVHHVGENTEPPYYAVLVESKDLYGGSVGFGMYAGTFSCDGFKANTLTDEDFTPEPGEYVYAAISKKIGDEKVTVGFADDAAAVEELKIELFGPEASALEK
ncbi:phage tail protein [Enterococcus sp. DIV1420a]|uniref:phage tail protein n=1 Tax=Enterococcus sp. DIV1420a TaxID=2774672 RepID=UPI003F28B36C